ncbi:TetR/AcrR family transcriptional regulator [Williamsia sterculiae]|uniref:Transcriptional regulator, TetR family n=1 Tax=Williamsia sterculiae TaxID=1344003 RepID=A0A1N7E1P7_9NOCA|nr:TetR/AcrR family transcriptional regulator [Williamsia sterculiae]SIR81994.1 transcriptional regulator, TetR family [Williamsia sterculiae]
MLTRLSMTERREQLVACALRLAYRSGIGAVTVRAVADEAGVSFGIVHYCFESKDELVTAMIERTIAEQLDAFIGDDQEQGIPVPEVTDADEPRGAEALRELLLGTLNTVLRKVIDYPERWMLLVESTQLSLRAEPGSPAAGVARRQNELAEQFGAGYLRAVGAQTAMGWGDRERTVVRGAIQMVLGLIQWWLADGDDDSAARSVELLADWVVDQATPA